MEETGRMTYLPVYLHTWLPVRTLNLPKRERKKEISDWILSKSNLLLLVSPTLSTPRLNHNTSLYFYKFCFGVLLIKLFNSFNATISRI